MRRAWPARHFPMVVGVATGALVAATTLTSCGEDLQPCKDIPDGGCPLDRGGSCEDAACAALYACFDGRWSLHETCTANTTTSASATASSASSGCMPFEIDRTGEADGCTPDLLEPDCPAEALDTCAPCSLGCVDFFLCTADGWRGAAHCTDAGEVVADP